MGESCVGTSYTKLGPLCVRESKKSNAFPMPITSTKTTHLSVTVPRLLCRMQFAFRQCSGSALCPSSVSAHALIAFCSFSRAEEVFLSLCSPFVCNLPSTVRIKWKGKQLRPIPTIASNRHGGLRVSATVLWSNFLWHAKLFLLRGV